jgi:uncharacterized protein YdhG (YjbR/CyaY superfamily)
MFSGSLGENTMKTDQTAPQSIDEYIAGFPQDVQMVLEEIRQAVRAAAPDAEETISYQMPTFRLQGHNLVYFAAFKKHIGFYPAPIGVAEFEQALALYGAGKGTLKFPLNQPMPFDLISKLVKFRAQEILAEAGANL